MMKCGTVAIMGRPNVGKSTLLNTVMNMKLAITTDKAGTTRNIIEGIYQDKEAQIIFIDTPGIHKPTHKLGNLLNRKAYQNIDSADIILFLIDGEKGFGKGDQFVLKKIEENPEAHLFLLINKIDKMKKEQLIKMIDQVKEVRSFDEIIPISALKRQAVDDLISTIKKYLPVQEAIFSASDLTNVSTRFLMAEFVREKAMMLTREEVPHAITCYVENYEEEENLVHIQVLLVVDRENLKKILIGKQGAMMKKIGTMARRDMEDFLGKKVFLELHVTVMEKRRDQEKLLKELGFEDE